MLGYIEALTVNKNKAQPAAYLKEFQTQSANTRADREAHVVTSIIYLFVIRKSHKQHILFYEGDVGYLTH